jgi:acetylornithine deacetylase/succinyl-diaminopimelate desuccinylase-like protein
VVPLSATERAQIAALPFDAAAYREALGVDELFGEPGYVTYERLWTRPTLELVGMWGGFQGDGVKTVLPHEAQAKLTCRLVPNQEPARTLELIEEHVAAHAPRGVRVTFERRPSSGKPYRMPSDHPVNRAAGAVLRELYGREPYQTRMGGSVAVMALFLHHLQSYAVSFGFGLPDERFHAPDEFYRLASFRRGQVAYGRLLARLAGL